MMRLLVSLPCVSFVTLDNHLWSDKACGRPKEYKLDKSLSRRKSNVISFLLHLEMKRLVEKINMIMNQVIFWLTRPISVVIMRVVMI